jgi:hypothetical protein
MYPLAMSLPVNLGVEMSDKVTSRAVVGGSLGEMLIPLIAGELIHSEVCTLHYTSITTSVLLRVVLQASICRLEVDCSTVAHTWSRKHKKLLLSVCAVRVFCALSAHAELCIEVMHALALVCRHCTCTATCTSLH